MDEAMTEAALAKRVEIVNHAAQLFDERGFHSTTMAQIAAACGLRKPTLYHYFHRKDDILFEIHDELMDLLISLLRKRVGSPGTAIERLRGVVFDVFEVLATHRGHVGVFVEFYRELADDYRPLVARKRDQYADEFDRLIAEAQEEGSLRPLHPTLTRLSILGMISWAYQWYDPEGAWTVEDVAGFMWELIANGVLTRD